MNRIAKLAAQGPTLEWWARLRGSSTSSQSHPSTAPSVEAPHESLGLDSQAPQRINGMPYIQVFLYLQVLDFLTTLVGFKMGAVEASPFIRTLMYFGPATGVALSKLLACALAAVCIWTGRRRLLRWANYWYSGLVIWNLSLLVALKP